MPTHLIALTSDPIYGNVVTAPRPAIAARFRRRVFGSMTNVGVAEKYLVDVYGGDSAPSSHETRYLEPGNAGADGDEPELREFRQGIWTRDGESDADVHL